MCCSVATLLLWILRVLQWIADSDVTSFHDDAKFQSVGYAFLCFVHIVFECAVFEKENQCNCENKLTWCVGVLSDLKV